MLRAGDTYDVVTAGTGMSTATISRVKNSFIMERMVISLFWAAWKNKESCQNQMGIRQRPRNGRF